MKVYYNHKHLTDTVINNGWLHTGDLGSMDREGYVYFKGLKKNMLNSNGKNVYPKEVERLLKMNENIINVEIFGESDEICQQIIKANINVNNDYIEKINSFRKWCIENISKFKIPHSVNFY